MSCEMHSGIESRVTMAEKTIEKLDKRLNAIIFLLIANLTALLCNFVHSIKP